MEVLFIFSQLPMLAGGGMSYNYLLVVKLFKYLIIRKDNGIGKLKNSGGQGYALWDRGGSFLKIISKY